MIVADVAKKQPITHARHLSVNKSDVKHRNTLGCRDQYTGNLLRLWNSQDCETV